MKCGRVSRGEGRFELLRKVMGGLIGYWGSVGNRRVVRCGESV